MGGPRPDYGPSNLADVVQSSRAPADCTVNKRAVAHARKLIDARQYVLDSDWGERQPNAADENRFLKSHDWDEYTEWHLGLTDGATDEDQGALRLRVRRLPAHPSDRADRLPVPRAAEWQHKAVELAAHDVLQHLDKVSGTAST